VRLPFVSISCSFQLLAVQDRTVFNVLIR